MTTRYLIVWQIGSNNQTIDNTPIDVIVNDVNTAAEIYERILDAMEVETRQRDSIFILSVCKL